MKVFGEDAYTSDMNPRQLCMKIPKKRNKPKGHSEICSYIWHIDI